MAAGERETLVLIDTNAWRSSRLLSNPVSSALLFVVRESGTRIGFPEVIEREVRTHGVRVGRDARDAVLNGIDALRELVGEAPEVSLPDDEELQRVVDERLGSLSDLLYPVPFSIDVASRALDRVNAKKPPSHHGQQYKDAAIWEHVLDLAAEFDIHLITNDNAFFAQKQANELHPGLQDECEASSLEVRAYRSIGDCLEVLADEAPGFDVEVALQAVTPALVEAVEEPLTRRGLSLAERLFARVRAFVTEDPRYLALDISLVFSISGDADRTGKASVSGQCMYEPSEQRVFDVKLDRIVMVEKDATGETQVHQHVFMSGVSVVGRRVVRHTVRQPLPGGGEFVSTTDAGGLDLEDLEE